MYSDYRILKFILIILYCVIFIKNIEYVLFSVLAICIHELAHIVFLKISGVSIVNFKVSFLGFEIYLREKKCINRELIVYFVGSLSNILIGIVFLKQEKETKPNKWMQAPGDSLRSKRSPKCRQRLSALSAPPGAKQTLQFRDRAPQQSSCYGHF